MSNAVTRTHPGDRFYNPPAVRRHHHHQMLLQKQLHRTLNCEHKINSIEFQTRVESDETTLCMSNSGTAAPTTKFNLTNLDSLVESVTPVVPAHYFDKARLQGRSAREADMQPFFYLGDLWESFKEWSVYGVVVPLILSGSETVKQYYVPSLSGIQLYMDPNRLRRDGDDGDARSSRETSSAGSSDCEAEQWAKTGVDGVWGLDNLKNLNSQGLQRLSLRDKALNCSFNNETQISSSHGLLVYEYLEQEQPHHRKPLYDKVSTLASEFPEIKTLRSCDLLPASWVSVAWYPIYRIPMGPTLQNLDASFLTFHSLTSHARTVGKNQGQFDAPSGRNAYDMVASSKISLPVFGLASYKLRGSILTPSGVHEWQQANYLLQAADDWLRHLDVNLPDFQFFVSHNSRW
ncbi:uncharacterized protein LOC105642574 isoform X2 [Jatropha curcas]|uniref:uncharacterized protein LOC105642574 isoform X2 n=1 Tax=Jatropha curcas TaxID=180498 RepID=UPI0005FB09D2|nr:uncharacterized protein LOC105642574 isoform X2 [Jatropha curcas]